MTHRCHVWLSSMSALHRQGWKVLNSSSASHVRTYAKHVLKANGSDLQLLLEAHQQGVDSLVREAQLAKELACPRVAC